MKTSKKAVCYYRYSSASQTEQSIEGQQRVCREYAEKHGYEIIDEYIDRAITGKTDNRPAFIKMIQESKNKEFEYVLVYKLDRFSRKRYHSVAYKYQLEQNGVKVISATEEISESAEGKVMTAILEAFAEMYSDDLSQKVKRGIKESILKGNFIGGHVPYGYKVIDKKVYIDEDEAEILRKVFQDYADGKSQKDIIQDLNRRYIKTKNGTEWKKNSLQNIFANKKYIGEYTSKQGIVNNDLYPQIIEKELFLKVQEICKKNKHYAGGSRAKESYVLSGKTFCGYCGAKMVGTGGTSKTGERHNYYACSKRWKGGKCEKKAEDKKKLENFIAQCTLEHVLNKRIIKGIAEELIKEQTSEQTKNDLKEINRKIAKIERELDEKFKDFCNTSNADLKKRIEDSCNFLSIKKEELQKEATRLLSIIKGKRTTADIIEYFNRYTERRKKDLDYLQQLVENFVESVYIFNDKIIIYYNVFNTNGVTYEKMLEDKEKAESGLLSTSSYTNDIGGEGGI